MSFGFIVLRHVNSEKTNKYWNQCVKLLRTNYLDNIIVIIDDDSICKFIKSDYEYKNMIYIQSEYPKRGELLPYIYYLRNKWFDSAVIIHDSTFIHTKINFQSIRNPVLPLWHFKYDKENFGNLIRISMKLKNNNKIIHKLRLTSTTMGLDNIISGCFGVQCYIRHAFLQKMDRVFNISSIIPMVTCRSDRCALERIMAAMFHHENIGLYSTKSLMGCIFSHHRPFDYTFDEYESDFKSGHIAKPILKVWTGR